MQRKSRGFKRSGLHRFECSCGNYTYSTVAAVERFGVPVCPCGERFLPGRVELAFLLGIEDCPAMEEYSAKLQSVAHGQAWTGNYGARPADQAAHEYVEQQRRERARANRLNALHPVVEPIPF